MQRPARLDPLAGIPALLTLLALLAGTVLVLAPACGSRPPAPETPAFLAGGWRLVSIDTHVGIRWASEAGATPTLTFNMEAPEGETGAGGRLGGFTGINRFSGSFRAEPGGWLSISPLAATKAGGSPAAMDFERTYLAALETASSWQVELDVLEVACEAGILRFTAADGSPRHP